MASRLYDGFGRNGSTDSLVALGTSDSGHAWQDLSSAADSIGIKGNRAWLATTPALTAAVLDAGVNGQDGSLSCGLLGRGAGLGLYFRVVDFDDWWRTYQRIFTYQYQTGTETYVSGYTTVKTGTETYISGYTIVEYEWRQNYTTGSTHDYSDLFGKHHRLAWSTSSIYAPLFSSSISHNHYHNTGDPDNDIIIHHHVASGSPYRTGVTRGGQPIYSTRDVYQQQPIYSTRPTFATTTGYELRLERMVLGALTTVAARQISGPFPGLSVVMNGNKIDAYASGSSTPISVTDSAHNTATKHGIGLGKPTELLNQEENFIDDFLFVPVLSGGYQPHVLL